MNFRKSRLNSTANSQVRSSVMINNNNNNNISQ
jgi:hypothetical protein